MYNLCISIGTVFRFQINQNMYYITYDNQFRQTDLNNRKCHYTLLYPTRTYGLHIQTRFYHTVMYPHIYKKYNNLISLKINHQLTFSS